MAAEACCIGCGVALDDDIAGEQSDFGAFLARLANGGGARRRARAAARSLRARVEEVGHELVVDPVEAEIDVQRRFCEAVASARRGGRRRR